MAYTYIYKLADEQLHLFWRQKPPARGEKNGTVSEPARGLLIFEFRLFRGVKILANRSKAGEQNVLQTHTSQPARRLYTDKLFGLRFRSLEFQRQRNIKRKKS